MRSFIRYLNGLNKKYDSMKEPGRFLIFIVPLIMVSSSGVMLTLLNIDSDITSIVTAIMLPLCGVLMLGFRAPGFISKNWINTYKIGLPYIRTNKVEIEYINKHNREEITKWTSKNTKFYRGIFTPINALTGVGTAAFYFVRESDAMAFKLAWI